MKHILFKFDAFQMYKWTVLSQPEDINLTVSINKMLVIVLISTHNLRQKKKEKKSLHRQKLHDVAIPHM